MPGRKRPAQASLGEPPLPSWAPLDLLDSGGEGGVQGKMDALLLGASLCPPVSFLCPKLLCPLPSVRSW